MKNQITTFLTFQESDAEETMNFYVELFENSKIIEVRRHGKEGPAKEGTVLMAIFELNGKPLDNYGFSARFGWVEDEFGISWQSNFQ